MKNYYMQANIKTFILILCLFVISCLDEKIQTNKKIMKTVKQNLKSLTKNFNTETAELNLIQVDVKLHANSEPGTG